MKAATTPRGQVVVAAHVMRAGPFRSPPPAAPPSAVVGRKRGAERSFSCPSRVGRHAGAPRRDVGGRPERRAPAAGHAVGMGLLGIILGLVISGVVFGYLGRLAVPGPNPMSVGR